MMAVLVGFWPVVGWVVLVLAALAGLLLGVPPIRRLCITGPFLKAIRPRLPRISATEQEALDAGTVWWDAELFTGKPNFERLTDTQPKPLSADERDYLDTSCDEICAAVDDWECFDVLRDLPDACWDLLKSTGSYGLRIPVDHGGKGLSARCFSDAMVRYASRSVALFAPSVVGSKVTSTSDVSAGARVKPPPPDTRVNSDAPGPSSVIAATWRFAVPSLRTSNIRDTACARRTSP